MEKQSSALRLIVAFLIGIALSYVAWFLVLRPAAPAVTVTEPVATTTADTSNSTVPAVKTTNTNTNTPTSVVKTPLGDLGITGNGKIEIVPTVANANVPAPVYSKPLAYATDVPQEIRAALNAQFTQNQSAFAKNKLDFNAWIDLGMLRKQAGDYQGAREVWEYVSKVWPGNNISFSNLGDLYQNFLHDYAKAELNYKAALKNNPMEATPYRALFDLYSNTSYKPTATAAVDILKEGVAKNPAAMDLHVLLARYYIRAGNASAAQIEYKTAINLAHEQGNTDAEKALTAESAAN